MSSRPHDKDSGGSQLPVPAVARGGELRTVDSVSPGMVLAELRKAEAPADDEINLLDYWNILVKRRWIVLSFGLIAMTVAFVNTLLMVPVYRTGATIQIDRDTLNVVNVEGVNPQMTPRLGVLRNAVPVAAAAALPNVSRPN
ncbi:MAG: hypothetical protein IPP28_02340 [Xanthomonadales bacterium]|nr:hypothetical protein [Xanthomonadales bacterium]